MTTPWQPITHGDMVNKVNELLTRIFALEGGTSVNPTAGTAIPALEPYANDSIWKIGRALAAALEASNGAQTAKLLDNPSGKVWVNYDAWSHDMVKATASDPLKTMTDTTDSSRTRNYHIPISAVPSAGGDAHLHVLQPDGVTLMEAFAVTVTGTGENKTYTASRVAKSILTSNGLGPQAGTRAYGGGALAGLVRHHEVDPSNSYFKFDPRYPGENVPLITHAIAFALRNDQMKDVAFNTDPIYYASGVTNNTDQPGWQPGISRVGFMQRALAYVWPATEADADAANAYTGTIPMGAYFTIPNNVAVPSSIASNKAARAIWHAIQDYGAYVTDRSGSSNLYVETKNPLYPATDTFVDQLITANYSAQPIRDILAQCRIVTSNNYANPNGGPVGAERRGYPVKLLDVTSTPAPTTTSSFSWTVTEAEGASWDSTRFTAVTQKGSGVFAINSSMREIRTAATGAYANALAVKALEPDVGTFVRQIPVRIDSGTTEAYVKIMWWGDGDFSLNTSGRMHNCYLLDISTGFTPNIQLRRVSSGSQATVGSTANFTFTAAAVYLFEVNADASAGRIQIRWWAQSGGTRPSSPQIDVTEAVGTGRRSGAFGLSLESGNAASVVEAAFGAMA